MDKSNQYIWDKLMIENFGYIKDGKQRVGTRKMGKLAWKFIKEVNPDVLDEHGHMNQDAFDYLNSLELRRCRDRDHDGKLKFIHHKMSVDNFIGSHSMPLLLALLDPKIENEFILKNIRLFKWVRHNSKIRNKSRANNARESLEKTRKKGGFKTGRRLEIRVRERDARHDWSTVK